MLDAVYHLASEVELHETAHATVLLCEARLREILPDEPPPATRVDWLDEADPT